MTLKDIALNYDAATFDETLEIIDLLTLLDHKVPEDDWSFHDEMVDSALRGARRLVSSKAIEREVCDLEDAELLKRARRIAGELADELGRLDKERPNRGGFEYGTEWSRSTNIPASVLENDGLRDHLYDELEKLGISLEDGRAVECGDFESERYID